MTFMQSMLIAGGGVLAYELVRLYELMGKLPAARFKKLIAAPFYWPITVGLIVGSAFISWAINANTQPTAWQLIVAAIGARSLIVKPVEVHVASAQPTLGESATSPEAKPSPKLSDMFS